MKKYRIEMIEKPVVIAHVSLHRDIYYDSNIMIKDLPDSETNKIIDLFTNLGLIVAHDDKTIKLMDHKDIRFYHTYDSKKQCYSINIVKYIKNINIKEEDHEKI